MIFAKMASGPQFLTEGSTEVSKHLALYDHKEGDISMKTVGYSQNFMHRGIKEAIEIYRRNPALNLDEGRKYLNPIYHRLISRVDGHKVDGRKVNRARAIDVPIQDQIDWEDLSEDLEDGVQSDVESTRQ